MATTPQLVLPSWQVHRTVTCNCRQSLDSGVHQKVQRQTAATKAVDTRRNAHMLRMSHCERTKPSAPHRSRSRAHAGKEGAAERQAVASDDVALAALDHKAQVAVLERRLCDEQGAPLQQGKDLAAACKDGRVDDVKHLVADGASLDAPNACAKTPLLLASQYGHREVVRHLLDKGADISVTDRRGLTALHWASRNGHVSIITLLVAQGADVEARDKYGFSPLHMALHYGHLDVVQQLLACGADVEAGDEYDRTPLHLAAMNDGFSHIARELAAQGADLEARDKAGRTPLHWASFYGCRSTVSHLVEIGADKGAKDRDGKSPLDLAAQRTGLCERLMRE
eukprot:jgi/Mesvir1/20648/Mv14868-RA.2